MLFLIPARSPRRRCHFSLLFFPLKHQLLLLGAKKRKQMVLDGGILTEDLVDPTQTVQYQKEREDERVGVEQRRRKQLREEGQDQQIQVNGGHKHA